MNSRERMCRVLNHEVPDRLPTWEYAIDEIVTRKLCASGTYVDAVEELDLDAVAAFETSCGAYVPGLLDRLTPGDRFQDQWGVQRQYSGEMMAYPLEDGVPIRDETDLRNYAPPDPGLDSRFEGLRQAARRFGGERLIVYVLIGPWEISKFLMGMQEFLAAMVQRPELVRGLFELTSDWMVEVARSAIDIGADMVMVADDLGHKTGLFSSPRSLQDLYIPCVRHIAEAVRERRAYSFFHSHGNIWEILDALVDTGIDVLHPMAYEDQMHIGIVKRLYGSRIAVAGNIATGLLTAGSREDVTRLVRDTIATTSAGGGHMMMASSSLPSGVNPDNYRAMVEAVHTYGRY